MFNFESLALKNIMSFLKNEWINNIYKTIQSKAAKLGYFIINNHPFVDWNKRIGILVMMTFFEINGIELNCTG